MKNTWLYLMVLFYVAAGVNHFVHPLFYLAITPRYLPFPLALVYISGACEALFALLLVPKATRRVGAWLLVILLIAIFPANVQMAVDYWRGHNPHLWIALLRLPLQVPLVLWAARYTNKQYTYK